MSPNPRGLVQGALDSGSPAFQILSGYVSLNQPAPASFSDPVYVIVPSHDPSDAIGPLTWGADHGSTLPVQGTVVVIGLDEYGQFHLLSWEGTMVIPGASGPAGGALSGDYPNPTVTNLPKFLTYGSVTVTYPGGQGYTPVANITPSGGPTGMCYAVASCQTDSSGEGRNVATISADVAAAFVNANTIDGSSPSGGTTVLIAYTSWATS